MNVVIVPARGGSKRIPKKNIKEFCGKPIISYPILELKKSNIVNKVIVSTDDKEIAAVAKKYGAEIPFIRPKNISDDITGIADVIRHAILYLQQQITIENVCCVLPTAPFISAKDIDEAFNLLIDKQCQFVFSATKYNYPVQRSFIINDKNQISMLFPENYEKRSQDLEEVFHDAGQFYWGNKKSWLSEKNIINSESHPYLIPHYQVQDIDTVEDWLRAEDIEKIRKIHK